MTNLVELDSLNSIPVSVVMPVKMKTGWQLSMTKSALETLRCTTNLKFELVVVETGTDYLKEFGDVYINIPDKESKSPNYDLNVGLAAASGDYVVYTQNDIFTRPGWLEALLECFAIGDCGLATLASADLKHTPVAQFFGKDVITESLYGPFMMMRKGEMIDAEAFPCQMGDTDLIMRIYRRGLRMYKNNRVIIEHLNRQTLRGPENDRDLENARVVFQSRHGGSPVLLVYRALSEGWIF